MPALSRGVFGHWTPIFDIVIPAACEGIETRIPRLTQAGFGPNAAQQGGGPRLGSSS
jgi:hypothetical protein